MYQLAKSLYTHVMTPPSTWPTQFWHKTPDGRIQCDVCPRHCQLSNGQRGLCFVRACEDDQIVLTTYGRSSGFCIDPIEKKPLNHFYPGTPVLSFGTAGCNLTYKFCQNWDMSKARDMDKLMNTAMPQHLANAARNGGCVSVAYTYNDPIIFMEYATDTAWACRDMGLKNVAVTAGYITAQAREAFFAPMDAVNIDLKAFSDTFYHKITTSKLDSVLETIVWVVNETPTWVELTTLLIPDANDSEAEIHALCNWVSRTLGPDVPLHFSAFNPDYKMRDRPRTPLETLLRARRIAKSYGLHHVYCGNVHHPESDATYCTGCGTPVISRDWYQITGWHLDETGQCRTCQTPLAGHVSSQTQPLPGTWGRKRKPVSIMIPQ